MDTFQRKVRRESWKEVYETQLTDEKSKVFMEKLCKMFEDSFPKQRSVKRANQIGKVNLPEMTKRRRDELRQMGERIKVEKNLERENQQRAGKEYGKPESIAKLESDYRSLQEYVGFLLNDAERAGNDYKMNKAKNKPKGCMETDQRGQGRLPRVHE
jgi:hypothetical protein